MANDGFVFTDHMVTVSNQLWAVTSAVGAVLCFIVLIVIFILSLHRSSRVHLDRVSFRLLKWALVSNMFFGIFSAIGGSLTGPGFLCGFSIFILQLSLEWSCFLLFAIALNLQLVVVHHVNGQKMEKYYLIGAAALALGITVPPYAAKQYGWDPLVQDCWYTNDNQAQRLAWQIGTQLLWTGLTVIGEVVASVTVIVYMIRHQSKRRQLGVSSLHTAMRSTTRSRAGSTASAASKLLRPVDHANAYKNIVFRIGLYPITSCIINLTSIMCVIHATVTDGVHDMTDYNILLLSDFLYGGRAVVYALLAATDPALLRAARAFISHMLGRPFLPSRTLDSKPSRSRLDTVSSQEPVFVSFELDTVKSPLEESGTSLHSKPSFIHTDRHQLDSVDQTLPDSPSILGPGEGAIDHERPFQHVTREAHTLEERAIMRHEAEEKRREESSVMFRKQI